MQLLHVLSQSLPEQTFLQSFAAPGGSVHETLLHASPLLQTMHSRELSALMFRLLHAGLPSRHSTLHV